jgi:tRNA nucleotidyltransferase/poly(A) polymerase
MVCFGTPAQISDIFSHTISVGARHGTIIVMIDHEQVEVSTYRYVELDREVSALERDLAEGILLSMPWPWTRMELYLTLGEGRLT